MLKLNSKAVITKASTSNCNDWSLLSYQRVGVERVGLNLDINLGLDLGMNLGLDAYEEGTNY